MSIQIHNGASRRANPYRGAETRLARLGIYEPSPGPSGPGRYVQTLLDGIDPAEFDVTMFCHSGGPYRETEGVRIVNVDRPVVAKGEAENGENPVHSGSGKSRNTSGGRLRALANATLPPPLRLWSGFARDARRLARRFRQARVDILHTQNAGCEEAPLAARLAGVPAVVGTFHVDSTYDLEQLRSGFTHRALEHISNHCLHAAIAVSEATKRDWICRTRLPERRVTTIHNGIAAEHFQRSASKADARRMLGLLDGEALLVGGVGRLDSAKGFQYLIEAAALLASDFPRLIVVIAGTGSLREELASRAAALGIADRLRFLGFVSDVRQVYDAIDVFALPSLCEALPYALLEAMSHELPVVGTTVAGVPEVIAPGETGFLAKPRDAGALAAALKPLLESADLRQRMGIAGRERIMRHFQERDCVSKTIELYRQVLAWRAYATSTES